MLIGSITNQGSLQGEMNNANGYLTGVITSAGQLGGQVVGLRGLKGDKGDTGDTGNGIASVTFVSSSGLVDTYKITFTNGTETTFDVTNGQDGIDGVDGHSPVVTASKVGKVTTVYVDGSPIATLNDGNDGVGIPVGGTIGQVLTKDSNTDYDVAWADSSGGATAFIAEYGVTSYADIKDAYDEDAIIICTADDSGNTVICQLAYYDDENGIFYFAQPQGDGFYVPSIASDDTWDDGYFQFASTDTATQLRNGLMDALDKQKLDNIASGAEVNVQSDWNQSVNTADDFIKNKPTIPSKTSDLNNDSGFITGMTILSYGNSTWQNFIDAYNANRVVYCRAGSGDNPTTAPQTRLAFMAYVNSATPTEVEFQYYRSVSSHSDAQQGDQVYVYKLKSNGTWSVTTREAYTKIANGTGISKSYSSGTLTLSLDTSAIPKEVFIAEYGTTTFADVLSAYNAGATILCSSADSYSKFYYQLESFWFGSGNNDRSFYFTALDNVGACFWINLDEDGTWTSGSDLATLTPTASKVAKFDNSAHMRSTDMTSQEVEDFVDDLDITGGLLGDYVVEQGTSGIWTYRKWNSGIAECWSEQTVSVNFATQVVSNFRMTATATSTSYPDIFASITGVLCSASHDTNNTWLTLASGRVDTTAKTVNCGFYGWNTGGSQSVILSINMKGTFI